jgi:hypothetical protein
MRQAAAFAAFIGLLTFVLGFAYGNLFEVQYAFHLKDWQTLASTLVAIVAAAVGYFGVRTTQRINVLIKEQDRIDELLPGLRQVDDVLRVIRSPLHNLRPQHRYQAHLILDAAFKTEPGESVEDVVPRKIPLADNHLKREVASIVFALKYQATLLRVGHDEVERYQRNVANINTFAPEARDNLREVANRVYESHERENEMMGGLIKALDQFAGAIKQRISQAGSRFRLDGRVLLVPALRG